MDRRKRPDQRGFSLLEVMIAGAVLALALLGLAALALRSLQDAADALDHRLAAILLADLQGRVTLSRPADAGGPTASVAAAYLAWQRQARNLFPASRSSLCLGDTPVAPTAPGTCAGAAGSMAELRWHRRPGGEERRLSLRWRP